MFDNFTTEQLEEELEKRNKIKLETEKTKPVQNPNIYQLIEVCQRRINEIGDEVDDPDTKHYVYEAAMTAVFGDGVWKYINDKISGRT